MIGRTNTGGGGGGGLNFRVLNGTSAPTSPKENDIWVNTETKFAEWAFASEEPFRKKTHIDCVIGTTDSMLNASGAVASYPQSNITEYTKLPEGTTKITVSNCDVVSSTMSHAFYTANKTLISTVERKKGVTTYEVPSGAVYVRLTLFDNSPLSFDPMSFVASIGVEDGFLWVSTGTESGVAFNALKKNGIQVYPISAKQYVSGAWVDKTAKSYQNGAWVDWWNGELYDNGNEYEYITGGWKVIPNNGYSVSLTKNASTMKLSTNSAEWSGLVGIKNTSPMDLSRYNTMRVVIKTGNCPDSVTHGFGIVNNYNFADFSTAWTAKGTFKGAGTYDLNISGISSGLPLLQSTVSGSFEVEQILLL